MWLCLYGDSDNHKLPDVLLSFALILANFCAKASGEPSPYGAPGARGTLRGAIPSSRANGRGGWAPGDAHCSTIDNRAGGV